MTWTRFPTFPSVYIRNMRPGYLDTSEINNQNDMADIAVMEYKQTALKIYLW